MKYIRTKDGRIYEENKVFVVMENNIKIVILGSVAYRMFIERIGGISWNSETNVVIKEADTIKELCDAFVIKWSFNNEYYVYSKEELDRVLSNPMQPLTHNGKVSEKIYGAIWTDKGLIYVAKMNKKGDLELL